jgi:hypothetical protein
MRTLLTLTLAATLATAGYGAYLARDFNRRLAAIEQRAPALALAPAPAAGAWRASNGVVLTADDLARLDARDRELDKHAAEIEYSLLGRPEPPRVKRGPIKSGADARSSQKP